MLKSGGVRAAHASIVSGKIIRRDAGADSDRRVDGAEAAGPEAFGGSRPPYVS